MTADAHRWLPMTGDNHWWLPMTCRWPADVHRCLLMTTNENWWCECLLILRLKFCLSIPRCALMHRCFDVISQIPCFWLQDTPIFSTVAIFFKFLYYKWHMINPNSEGGADSAHTFFRWLYLLKIKVLEGSNFLTFPIHLDIPNPKLIVQPFYIQILCIFGVFLILIWKSFSF